MRRRHHCRAEVIECPSHCRFSGWKHAEMGLHACWPQAAGWKRQIVAYRPVMSAVVAPDWHPSP